jgi:hypothetical protein
MSKLSKLPTISKLRGNNSFFLPARAARSCFRALSCARAATYKWIGGIRFDRIPGIAFIAFIACIAFIAFIAFIYSLHSTIKHKKTRFFY